MAPVQEVASQQSHFTTNGEKQQKEAGYLHFEHVTV